MGEEHLEDLMKRIVALPLGQRVQLAAELIKAGKVRLAISVLDSARAGLERAALKEEG